MNLICKLFYLQSQTSAYVFDAVGWCNSKVTGNVFVYIVMVVRRTALKANMLVSHLLVLL